MRLVDIRWILSGIALGQFSACAVGPDYVRPSAPVPDTYKEAGDWKPAQPRDELNHGSWWESFHDPQLDALERLVSISNQNVAQAEAQYRQALTLVRSAQAGYFPILSANLSATHSGPASRFSGNSQGTGTGTGTGSPGNTNTGNGSIRGQNELSLSADAIWDIDVWGRVRRTVEGNEASAQASASDLEAMRLSIQGQLAQDYFQLRVLDELKRLLDDTVADYEKSLQLTRNRYAVGVAAKAEVSQAETQLKTTQAQTIDIGVQRAQLEHAIAVLIGKSPAEFSISPKLVVLNPPDIPLAVPSNLLERRPDIAAAERRVAAANAQIGVAKSAYFPDISLSASGESQSSNLIDLLSLPSLFWSLGSQFAETLFDAGARRAKTDQAIAAYDQSVANYRQTVLTGFQEVEDNLAQLRILVQEAQVQSEAVTAAKESVTLTTNQYKAGTVSYLDVVTAQTAMLSDERNALNILGGQLTASVLLIKALGGDWHVAPHNDVQQISAVDHPDRQSNHQVWTNLPVLHHR